MQVRVNAGDSDANLPSTDVKFECRLRRLIACGHGRQLRAFIDSNGKTFVPMVRLASE